MSPKIDLPSPIQTALADKPKKEFPVHDKQEINTACKDGKPIVIHSLASMNVMLWGLIIGLPLFNLIPWANRVTFTPDELVGFWIFVNVLAVGIFLPFHFFLNYELKKNIFVMSCDGIYARFRPFAKRLTQSPGPKPRYREMEALLDRDFPMTFSWLERYFRWSEVAEVREELTAQQPYGKGTVYRWPIFQITDATSQTAEIRGKLTSTLAARLMAKDPRWEFSIFLKGGGPPICLYLENFLAKGMRDVESLFLLSSLVNQYWRSSKQQSS